MSSEKKPNTALSGVIETLKSNPKAMAAAGVAVALVLFLVLKGSGDEGVSPAKVAITSIGQTVTIKNPNVGNTILLAAPGAVGLADSDNDKDDMIICRNVLSGTTATVNEESTVNYIPFVKLTLNDGECAGKTGWLAKVNIAAQ
jgi:hypothetical protein